MKKTLYIDLGGEEVVSDAQVEVVKVDLDFNFWLYLGEQLSSGLRIESRSALLSCFVEECPGAAKPLLAVWEKLKELVFGDSPSGSVPVMLGNDYFQWLKFSDMPQSVRDRYRNREELTLDVDVEELAEMALDDVRRTLRRSLNDTIGEVVFNHSAITRRSPLVRFMKKCNEDLVFIPFDRWTWSNKEQISNQEEKVKVLSKIDLSIGASILTMVHISGNDDIPGFYISELPITVQQYEALYDNDNKEEVVDFIKSVCISPYEGFSVVLAFSVDAVLNFVSNIRQPVNFSLPSRKQWLHLAKNNHDKVKWCIDNKYCGALKYNAIDWEMTRDHSYDIYCILGISYDDKGELVIKGNNFTRGETRDNIGFRLVCSESDINTYVK